MDTFTLAFLQAAGILAAILSPALAFACVVLIDEVRAARRLASRDTGGRW